MHLMTSLLLVVDGQPSILATYPLTAAASPEMLGMVWILLLQPLLVVAACMMNPTSQTEGAPTSASLMSPPPPTPSTNWFADRTSSGRAGIQAHQHAGMHVSESYVTVADALEGVVRPEQRQLVDKNGTAVAWCLHSSHRCPARATRQAAIMCLHCRELH